MPTQITPFLTFQGGVAERAMTFYTSLFDDGRVVDITRYGPEGPGPEGTVLVARFRLAGQEFLCSDSFVTHDFSFTPSLSLWIETASDDELQRLFAALGEGGAVLMPLDDYGFSRRFGWVNDRYGVSWQLNLPAPPTVPPESRDWTFVITEGCDECGFAPQPPEATGERLHATIPIWRTALAEADSRVRPAPTVWSTVEYGCHVRDTCRLFRQRLELMLGEDDPMFANWDQDVTAVEGDYFHQDPGAVADALAAEATETAAAFDAVRSDQWDRPGRRSNGSVFTVATFAVYFLHDIEHHVHDVLKGK